jgi:hypothetical protein
MLAKYVRSYSRGQKNDFRDAEAIAEAVQLRQRFATLPAARQASPAAGSAFKGARAMNQQIHGR